MEMKIVVQDFFGFVMVVLEETEMVLHYESCNELALVYDFKTQQAAARAYEFCTSLAKECEQMPLGIQEKAHRRGVEMYMSVNEIPGTVY
ncbi:hypothetical protein JTF06_10660 [Desemzia sp. RIT804]|uniref:hypothetical protein n=1 Tax=Desemzia sp. RIT 804 TaxID=2810209 RepID=UPI00194E7687|nr:hypothetical protein [Desemzia sp. RIT 804]MBM6615349.1 hypothetical protein [Desemzia sp. RIT 804]